MTIEPAILSWIPRRIGLVPAEINSAINRSVLHNEATFDSAPAMPNETAVVLLP
jgi:hypothetical protein